MSGICLSIDDITNDDGEILPLPGDGVDEGVFRLPNVLGDPFNYVIWYYNIRYTFFINSLASVIALSDRHSLLEATNPY
jgi:hypothetical protein